MLIKCDHGYITQKSARILVGKYQVAILGENQKGDTSVYKSSLLCEVLQIPTKEEIDAHNKIVESVPGMVRRDYAEIEEARKNQDAALRVNELEIGNMDKLLEDLKAMKLYRIPQ